MAPGPLNLVTVMEQFHVSPSPSPPAEMPRALPLTFFDLVLWDVPSVQCLFFYDNADLLGAPEFLLHELPLFKKSLAAALHHFYPLSGTLDLAGDHARDTARLHPLLPFLRGHGHGGGSRCSTQDVFAVQLTLFPHAGLCIGTTLHHAVADGSSYVHFMRTWAAIHRLGPECGGKWAVPPLLDRSVVRDDNGLR
ncbi:anthocyanin 5-aromatic acyltransferase-like [Hordeum vulgare]|nr:anthocyanin 5-aromatic acyltransferase-like [Hordeum vulgare]